MTLNDNIGTSVALFLW